MIRRQALVVFIQLLATLEVFIEGDLAAVVTINNGGDVALAHRTLEYLGRIQVDEIILH